MKVGLMIGVLGVLCLIGTVMWADAATEGLVLHYTFDAATIAGEEVRDMSGNDNTGTILGAPEIGAGKRADALDFSGASDCVVFPTSESLAETAGTITMEAWVYSRVFSTNEIISKWDNAMNGIIHFECRTGGTMRFCMRKEDDSKIADFTSTDGFPTEAWTHIAETYDGETARIYFDGEEVSSMAGSGEMRENEDVQWWIGSMYATDRWFNGLIDEVRIWSRALTPVEIQQSIEGTLVSAAVDGQNKLPLTWALLKR